MDQNDLTVCEMPDSMMIADGFAMEGGNFGEGLLLFFCAFYCLGTACLSGVNSKTKCPLYR